MKAAVFYNKHNIRIEDIAMPKAKNNEVIVKVMACGICGTDVHIFEGDEGAAKTPSKTVLGHEFSGIVVSIGKDVTNVKIGDRVCVDPNVLCDNCYYCLNSIGHFCENMIGIGTTVNGGFEEYCAVLSKQVHIISDSTTFEEAAMAEPVSCCLHGIDLCEIKPTDVVTVIGCGMIGLIMIQLAKLFGAKKVIALEIDESKRNQAIKAGADIFINSNNEDVYNTLSKMKIDRISKVIECAGTPKTMEQAISLAGKKSTVMFFGLTKPNDYIKVKPFEIFKKEIEIKASYINPYTQQRAIELICDKRIDVSSMVYKVYSLDDLPKILENKELLKKGKIIINPNL